MVPTIPGAKAKEGGAIVQTERSDLAFERDGVRVEFQLREKYKQVRRPLTKDEEGWASSSDKGWRQDLNRQACHFSSSRTIRLRDFVGIGLTEAKAMETMLPGIVATFIAAVPFLLEEKRKRDEAAERWRQAEQRGAEDEYRRRLDDARWRKFLELAGEMRKADLARELLDRIKAAEPDLNDEAGVDTVSDWLGWAEARIEALDPLQRTAAELFTDVAATNVWDYRD